MNKSHSLESCFSNLIPCRRSRTSLLASLALIVSLFLGSCASPGNGKSDYSGQLNLNSASLALSGFDPVSYFDAGEGEPLRGFEKFTLQHEGVVYRFASEANLMRFQANPEHFAPAYGGWCAWAMADGDKVEVNPHSYLIQDGRLLLFYDGLLADTRAMWLKKDVNQELAAADEAWEGMLDKWRRAAPPSK